ncbi:MAG: hypothetical protein ACYDDU_10240 [Dermatophilaceae bacterium]
MTPAIFWALLAVAIIIAIAIAIAIAASKARASKARAKARSAQKVHRIDQDCASNGHAYVIEGTGWRCATCGNHVSRKEGELYGLAEDGRIERRREPR